MSTRSVLQDARDIDLACTLIDLGARLQFLESEIPSLSRERLVRLYRELKGGSPPKGLLPFSADWFMTWMANIHASLFYNLYCYYLRENPAGNKLEALISSYKMYLEHMQVQEQTPVLDFTRACILVRYAEIDMVQLTECATCTGSFITHKAGDYRKYVCVLCRPPSRAGKPARQAAADQVQAVHSQAAVQGPAA